jgi:DNA repair protein RadA/Sms
MILAVLEARCGLNFSDCDVYLNIAGGLRIQEPGADLAIAAAMISALTGYVIPSDTVFFGEVGLAGEIRPTLQMELRLKEANKLGFKQAICPANPNKKKDYPKGAAPVKHINDLVSRLQMEPKKAVAF